MQALATETPATAGEPSLYSGAAPRARHSAALYGSTIALAAFLLFQVQPLIAKAILPWFGGGASVWATCLVFFQGTLFLGYLYAHLVAGLDRWKQALLHSALAGLTLAFLPLHPDPAWKPHGGGSSALGILELLATTVGLPFFLLASTSPLIQAWYSATRRGSMPYRLYALSNVASLAGLLGYPFLVEPLLGVPSQARIWSAGFAGFVLLSFAAALAVWKWSTGADPPAAGTLSRSQWPPWTEWTLWVALPACASALLVALTSHLTQNVAPIPFLWILPLTLYLLSFVLCFDSSRWYRPNVWRPMAALALYAIAYQWVQPPVKAGLTLLLGILGAAFFACVMFCHGELARRKPDPRLLTYFYLMISFGGALGGLLAGVAAPYLFTGYYELPVILVATALTGFWTARLEARRMRLLWGAAALLVAFFTGKGIWLPQAGQIYSARNFYGVLRVQEGRDSPSGPLVRVLYHGTIAHGAQQLSPETRRAPTTYYCESSGAGLLLSLPRRGPRRIGVVGLGAGTLATYGRTGDVFRIYELDPAVIQAAHRFFSFLSDSQARVEIVPGDARLSLEAEPPQKFDVLLIDAFSGDSVPAHLLTLEALDLYLRHLAPGGAIAFHLSNRYLNLSPVARGLARARALNLSMSRDEPSAPFCVVSEWAVLSRDPAAVPAGSLPTSEPVLWTDHFSNLWRVLR